MLSDGMSAICYSPSGHQEVIAHEILNPMVWATGRFVYDDDNVQDVIKDLSSYYHVNINADGTIGNKRITGSFPAVGLHDVLDMISQVCGMEFSIQ